MLVTLVVVPVALLLTPQLRDVSAYGTSDPVRLTTITAGLAVLVVVAGLRTFKPALEDQEQKARSVLTLRELAPEGVRVPVVLIVVLGVFGWLVGWSLVSGVDIGLLDFPHIPRLGRG